MDATGIVSLILPILLSRYGLGTAAEDLTPDNTALAKELAAHGLGADSAVDDALRRLVEAFRATMTQPNPALGNMTLDPFRKEHEDVKLNMLVLEQDFPLQLNGYLRDVEVTKLSTFEIEFIQYNLMWIDFGFLLPQFDVKGYYLFDGDLSNLVHIFGEGPFNALFKRPMIKGHMTFGLQGQHVVLRACDFNFSLEYLSTDMQGLFGGGQLSRIINEVFSELAGEIVSAINPELSRLVAELLVPLFNENVLKGLTLKDILDYINGLTS